MDLDPLTLITSHETDPDYLNSISLILGKIINIAFQRPLTEEEWEAAFSMTHEWIKSRPDRLGPYSRRPAVVGTPNPLPPIYFLHESHGSTMHYYLVTLTILGLHLPHTQRLDRLIALDAFPRENPRPTKKEFLQNIALDICGIAFSSKIPTVLVNAFGPMAYCARLINDEPVRQELKPLSSLLMGRRAFATVGTPRMPTIVKPSVSEIRNQLLEERNLETAVRALYQDGLVVIEDAVQHDKLDILNEKMVDDTRKLQTLGDKSPFNYNKGNLQQDAPPVSKYFFPEIFTNLLATQVTTAVLGPRPKWTFCSANSAVGKTPDIEPQRQPVHSDADFAHPPNPFALVVNVPLVTTKPENGSTELWLGTHTPFGIEAQEGAHGDRASGRIQEHLLRERQKISPPVQPIINKGSVVIRDLRLWHAGMPNYSPETRVMLAMIHFAPWYRNPMRLEFAEDVKPILEQLDRDGKLGLQVPVDWKPTEEIVETYLGRGFGNSYDFNQAP
ncbi:unnamed protein product [Clonostachys rosea]|uniref:Kanamycin B dioxygenase n=1 Tax=Bionectria ochroleuca TaxID=29856 RepID=A0ABY6V5W4_BIOOC|nr:unnamed protein product [Clonostachys rosea]